MHHQEDNHKNPIEKPLLGHYNVFDNGYFSQEYYMLNRFHKKVREYRIYDLCEDHLAIHLETFISELEKRGFTEIDIFQKYISYHKKEQRYTIDWVLFLNGGRISLGIDHDSLKDLKKINCRFSTIYALEDISYEDIEKITEAAEKSIVEEQFETKRYINIVGTLPRGGGLTLKDFEIKPPVIQDLDLYYGDGFSEKHERFKTLINKKNSSGLFIFHGVTGSGKTNYIRFLIGASNPEINFIFYPISLLREIASPELITFLTDYQNSVLIIEESEESVQSRDKFNADKLSIANLLNVSDGLLSDVLNLKIICTFNTDIRNLDKALLREGRLLGIHKFDRIPLENANKICEMNQREANFDKPATLAEIFNNPLNQDFSDFVLNTNTSKKIGF